MSVYSSQFVSSRCENGTPRVYTVRNLQKEDLSNGFLELLSNLTEVGSPSLETLVNQYDKMISSNNQFVLVAVDANGQLCGSASILIERKFIRNCRSVGHIEDVVTHPDHRGNGIAKEVVKGLESIARSQNCYKLILDCTEENSKVYASMGFIRKEIQMRKDL